MSKYWKFALAATALIATTAFAVAQMGSDHGHTSGPWQEWPRACPSE